MSGRPWTAEDRAIVEKMVAAGANRTEVAEAVGRSVVSVDNYRKAHGLAIHHRSPDKIEAPANFTELWAAMPIAKLAKILGRGPNTVRAWAAELGLSRSCAWRSDEHKAKPRKSRAKAEKPVKRLPDITPIGRAGHTAPVDTYQRDMSPAGQAADYLRQFGPVYRCTNMGRAVDAIVAGRANPEATHWRVGSAVVTSQELIDPRRQQTPARS